MLQAIRERTSGFVAIFIFGFLGILLIPFGAQQFGQAVTPDTVAKVGDLDVTRADFDSSFNNYRQRLRQLLGSNFDEFAYTQPLVRREHLESIIDQKLLENYANDSGMSVSPAQMTETIQSIPAFQIAGTFDQSVFRQFLASQGMNETDFLDDLRGSLVIQALTAGLQASAVPTGGEVDAMLALQNQTRSIDYVLFPAAKHVDLVSVDTDELETYYNENNNQFLQPEQVSLSYVEIKTSDFAVVDELDEQLLLDRYEDQKGRFVTEERRQASHILLTTSDDVDEADLLAQAESLSQRAKEGEDFSVLAEEFSQDPGSASNGGDLGWVETGIMVQAFEEALFALEKDAISEPVRTGFGYHVIWLRDIEPSTGKTFEQARDELAEEERVDLAERQFLEVADNLVTLSFEQPDALQSIADELGLDLKQTELFTRSGGTGIAATPEIIDAAFSDLLLIEQSNSEPIQLDPDHMLVARINEHIPSTPRPLTEVEVEVRNILQRQKASEQARAEAEALFASIESSGSLELALEQIAPTDISASGDAETEDAVEGAVAAKDIPGLITATSVTRTDFQLGQTLLQAIFAMNLPENGEAFTKVVPQNGQDWAIVRLNGVTSGDPTTASEAERQRLSQQLQRSLSGEEQSGLIAQLRNKYEVTVFEENL